MNKPTNPVSRIYEDGPTVADLNTAQGVVFRLARWLERREGLLTERLIRSCADVQAMIDIAQAALPDPPEQADVAIKEQIESLLRDCDPEAAPGNGSLAVGIRRETLSEVLALWGDE